MREHGAFILARYSTDRQNPDSIEVQVDKCTKWCNDQRVPILGVYADMAVSGMKDTRPQYEMMMNQLRQNMADMVVIYDQSRMFRKMTAWFAFRDELEAMGVSVVSVTQPMIGKDLRDPTNFLTEGSMALFNQIWALQTRQKVIEKMRFMARNGQHTGGVPPLGYAVQDGTLVVCEEEAAIVRRIFTEYANGCSYKDIIHGLNRDGLTTRNGKPFGSNSLHDLFRNEKYIGVIHYGKVPKRVDGKRNTHGAPARDLIRLENACPAIIDKETWEKVQIKMDANKRDKAGRPAKIRDYPLKGKIFCGECGAAMVHTASTSRSGRYHYYACSAKQRLHNCDLMPIKMEELERVVAEAVRNVLGKPGNVAQLIQILRNERNKLHNGAVDRLQGLITRVTEIDRQLEQAATAILSGLNSTTITRKVHELEAEKALLEREMRQLKHSMDTTAIPEEALQKMVEVAMDNDAAVLSIVARIEVSHHTITIWTIFDADSDGKIDKSKISEANLLSINGLDIDLSGNDFMNIVGVASPAPIKKAPKRVLSLLVSDGRDRTHFNATVRWTVACRQLDGGNSLIKSIPVTGITCTVQKPRQRTVGALVCFPTVSEFSDFRKPSYAASRRRPELPR